MIRGIFIIKCKYITVFITLSASVKMHLYLEVACQLRQQKVGGLV